MYRSRLSRYEERKNRSRIFLAITGSVVLLVFLGLFGLKILIGFSVFVDKLRGSGPKVQEQTILLPPEFDNFPEATNSAITWISGRATPDMTVLLTVNDDEPRKVVVKEDGTFKIEKIFLKEGPNSFVAKQTNEKESTSESSEILRITYKKGKPKLDISQPSDGQTINGDSSLFTISGTTDEGNTVLVNDRYAVVSETGSFSYDLNLADGEQVIKIVSKDIAGNETSKELKVTYRK